MPGILAGQGRAFKRRLLDCYVRLNFTGAIVRRAVLLSVRGVRRLALGVFE